MASRLGPDIALLHPHPGKTTQNRDYSLLRALFVCDQIPAVLRGATFAKLRSTNALNQMVRPVVFWAMIVLESNQEVHRLLRTMPSEPHPSLFIRSSEM